MKPTQRFVAALAGVIMTVGIAGAATVPTSATVPGVRAVGAIFESLPGPTRTGLLHICSGSVIASPDGDLVLTAAHCMRGRGATLSFAPMFANGKAPYGYWPITTIYETPAWRSTQDPQQDFAFVRVRPPLLSSAATLSSTVGSLGLAIDTGYVHTARIVGYPLGFGGSPIACTTATYEYQGYSAFNCDGYVDGTSGSPFIIAVHGRQEVAGDIGGLHQGGCSPSTSYSSYYGTAIAELYLRALTQVAGDIAPAAGSDGC